MPSHNELWRQAVLPHRYFTDRETRKQRQRETYPADWIDLLMHYGHSFLGACRILREARKINGSKRLGNTNTNRY